MPSRDDRPRLPAIHHDPTGELNGLPTYAWRRAPEGLLTRRQLAARGLRAGGQPVVALMFYRGFIYANLYRLDLAKPQFAKTPAKLAAVWTAARSRRRCVECTRTDLDYIPRQGEPAFGRCWDCMGLPKPDAEPAEWACPGCGGKTEVECPACHGNAGSCRPCTGTGLVACTMCQGL